MGSFLIYFLIKKTKSLQVLVALPGTRPPEAFRLALLGVWPSLHL